MPCLKDDYLYKTEWFQPEGLRENSCSISDILVVHIHNTCWSCERLESLLSNPVEKKFWNVAFALQLHALCTEVLQISSFYCLFSKGLTWLYCLKSKSHSWISSAEISTLLFFGSRTKNAALCEPPFNTLHCPVEQALILPLASRLLPLFHGLHIKKHSPRLINPMRVMCLCKHFSKSPGVKKKLTWSWGLYKAKKHLLRIKCCSTEVFNSQSLVVAHLVFTAQIQQQ